MTRGKWVAALAAVATLTACVVAPAAQADGTDDPNAAVSEAKAAYDRAVSDRDALKPARDKAQATLDEGTVGYFRARGADDAVRILTDPTVTKYAAEIGRDRKNTATSLDSMVKSLSYVREINGLRTGDNSALKPLDVSDSLMAVAEAHWDHFLAHEDDGPQHWGDFNIGENIGCWSEGFYQEKALYEKTHEDSSRTGHYLNIVKPSYVVTGWAEAYQEFDSDSQWLDPDWLGYAGDSLHQGRVMSVDDYEADVNAYKAPLDKAVSDYDDAAKAADDAKSAYDRAKAAADAWNNAMFTVSFDTAGGSDVKAQTVRRGGTVSKPTDPTRAGYLFGGWYQGDAKYDFSTPVSADLTLSAHWRADPSAKVFTVSFDPGNGQMISDRSVRAGQAISEPKAPTRSGYVFDGWYTAKTGGSQYDFSTPVTADLNLYAHWTAVAPKTFTVSFDTAGGSKVASQKVREGARVSEPADPTRSGHSFDGWYKGDAKYDFSTPVTADLTLTARWKAKAAPVVRTAAMHRLYNPYTGEHFYTADTAERDHLTGLGWRYEGVGWKAPAKSSTPVYRLYNGHVRGGDHHYTTSASERDHLVSVGWTYEGVGWYSDDAKGVPLYRQYNPYARTGTHNYTASASENDHLLAVGWRGEGVGWYGVGD